jgi:hypothetical protein
MTTLLDQATSHESIFTRGYEHGYVQAMIDSRSNFAVDVLASQVDELRELLATAGAANVSGAPERRLYGVEWCRLVATFQGEAVTRAEARDAAAGMVAEALGVPKEYLA